MANRNLYDSTTGDGQYSLFFSAREMGFFNDINVELSEIVAKQWFVYYPVEADLSDTNALYGESENKVSRNPVKLYGRIMLDEPVSESGKFTHEQKRRIEVYLHKDRLTETGIVVRLGDYIEYDNQMFEITYTAVDKFVHGMFETKLSVIVHAISTRYDIFSSTTEDKEIVSDSENPY